MDLNPYVFAVDMSRSNLCFKLCLFKAVSILTGRGTDFRKLSVEWLKRLATLLRQPLKKLLVLKFCDHSLFCHCQLSVKDFSNSRIAILLQSKYIRSPSQGNYVYPLL
jgi:hypothetical protein